MKEILRKNNVFIKKGKKVFKKGERKKKEKCLKSVVVCHLELQSLVDVVALEEGQHGVAEEVGGGVQLVVGDPGEGGEHRLLAERRHHHQQLQIVAYNTTQHDTPIIVCLYTA